MPPKYKSRLPEVIEKHEKDLLSDWIKEQMAVGRQPQLMKESELRNQCAEFLQLFRAGIGTDQADNFDASEWDPLRDLLDAISSSRSLQGFSPRETATFVFSFKRPLFSRLRKEINAVEDLANELWSATELLDQLGLYTTERHQKTREEIIARQQQEVMELSTPVIKLWDGILALPLIGTLDSARTQVVMESLLQRIVETSSSVAIIDITGVPTVDTLVAQHLLKTVTAARLMGAECIISGIRPQIAQTIVHLGVALGTVNTKANLADAFLLALQRRGVALGQSNSRPGERIG